MLLSAVVLSAADEAPDSSTASQATASSSNESKEVRELRQQLADQQRQIEELRLILLGQKKQIDTITNARRLRLVVAVAEPAKRGIGEIASTTAMCRPFHPSCCRACFRPFRRCPRRTPKPPTKIPARRIRRPDPDLHPARQHLPHPDRLHGSHAVVARQERGIEHGFQLRQRSVQQRSTETSRNSISAAKLAPRFPHRRRLEGYPLHRLQRVRLQRNQRIERTRRFQRRDCPAPPSVSGRMSARARWSSSPARAGA